MLKLSRVTAPARLLALFVVLTGVPLLALGWLGWRVLQQDRALERQRSSERMENAAALAVRQLDGALAAAEDLAELAANGRTVVPPAGSVLLIFDADGVPLGRAGSLPYLPSVRPAAMLPQAVFAAAETYEFRSQDLQKAAEGYRHLSTSPSPVVRAAALMRLARVRRKQRRIDAALVAYDRLAAMGEVEVAGSPSDLVARRERAVLFEAIGDHAAAAHEASLLASALSEGRFAVDRSTFEFYRDAVTSFDPDYSATSEGLALSEAAHALWPTMREKAAGRAGWTRDADAFVAVWRGTGSRGAAIIASLDSLMASGRADTHRLQVRVAVEDASRRQVFGDLPVTEVALEKTLSEIALPWTLQIGAADPSAAETTLRSRTTLFAASLGLMILVITASSYFVFRAVNKELAVARLQSDFVAAVSHEFRTPLTAMCHLTELLEDGQTPVDRVAHYHRALSKESRRLHAMVENLLDFGRIEAGRRTYELAELDALSFVDETVRDFREQRAEDGARIRFESNDAGCTPLLIHVDRSALAVALRNLMDNAIKYSPASGSVIVSVKAAGSFIGISVEDEGPGVSKEETQTIFRKFARGAAARSMNVKGTGIGLTMAAEIVRAHGGRLELTSEPGRGSRFTTLLPLHPRHT